MSWRKKTGGRKNLMEEVNGPWNQRPPMIFCGNPQHSETIRSCSSLQMSAREMPLGHCVCEEVILKFIWRAREPWISNMSLLFFFKLFYVWVFCLYVCMCTVCMCCPRRSEASCGHWEQNLGPLQDKEQVLFIAEQCFSPLSINMVFL